MKSITNTTILITSLASVLTACGGGGSSSGTSVTTPAATASTTTATTQVDSTCGFANFQAEMLARINTHRVAGAICGGTAYPAATALRWNGQLQSAATVMAADIARTGSHSHIGSDGSTFGSRITAAGYSFSYAGENISGGYGSVQGAVDGWMASQVHCENVMKAEFREIGASCVSNGGGETNFVLEFGAR
jgi:uncharacterized protein YkwD